MPPDLTVYLIPTGSTGYELYCEPALAPDVASVPSSGGVLSRLRHRFASVLREAEEQQQRGDSRTPPPGAGWWARFRHRALAWVAERIAEQRLLWNLRYAVTAALAHPDDTTFAEATTHLRRTLRRDYDRHRLWLVIDTVLLIASAVLAIVPGPNVVAYYFAFRVVGHWLSMRGATQALRRTEWSGIASPPLTELRLVAAMPAPERQARLQALATALALPNLPVFFDRVVP